MSRSATDRTACSPAAAGLEDLNGNDLDGDGNGTGGDDFVRTFRVDHLDAFANGNFDCSLDGWTFSVDSDVIAYGTDDVDDAGISGSAVFTNPAANIDLSIGQCVSLAPESNLRAEGLCTTQYPGRLDRRHPQLRALREQ